jgi:hypothetical protein
MKEYSRVVEEVVLTDEGVYKKGSVPDTYGGAQLTMEICNTIMFADARGQLLVLEMGNKEPLNKDRSEKLGKITLDGVQKRAGEGGEDRIWTTVEAKVLSEDTKTLATEVKKYMTSDGDAGTVV